MPDAASQTPQKPHLPEHLIIRCKVPGPDGRPCGFYRKYRVMDPDYNVFEKTPDEIQADVKRELQKRMLNYYQHHIEKQHPAESEIIRKQVERTSAYIIMNQLSNLIMTEHD